MVMGKEVVGLTILEYNVWARVAVERRMESSFTWCLQVVTVQVARGDKWLTFENAPFPDAPPPLNLRLDSSLPFPRRSSLSSSNLFHHFASYSTQTLICTSDHSSGNKIERLCLSRLKFVRWYRRLTRRHADSSKHDVGPRK